MEIFSISSYLQTSQTLFCSPSCFSVASRTICQLPNLCPVALITIGSLIEFIILLSEYINPQSSHFQYSSNPSSVQEEYKILDGADSSWTQDAHKGLVIRGNGEFSKFKFVKVDGIIVDIKNYTVSEGSTVVTLKEDYLNTLAAGKHTFEIVWTDGLASTTFTVVKDNNNLVQVTGNKNESITVKQDNKNSIITKTGDTTNYVLYSILLMISFLD